MAMQRRKMNSIQQKCLSQALKIKIRRLILRLLEQLLQLQVDYDLAYTVYSELVKQLETQQLQVKR